MKSRHKALRTHPAFAGSLGLITVSAMISDWKFRAQTQRCGDYNLVLVELNAVLLLCVVLDGGALNWSRCGNPKGPYDIGLAARV